MKNLIEACSKNEAKLIFFDNVYMYGPPPLPVPFAENCQQNPTTKKGRARKETVDLLLAARKAGKIKAIVGRSADFYGLRAVNSPFYISFLDRMLLGKAPQSMARAGIKHTYAYSEDNGRALVALALDDTAYGEVWHLPVGDPINTDKVVNIFNKNLGSSFKASYVPPFILNILGLIIRPLKEVTEMQYQFNTPYIMSFDKFKGKFPDFEVTSYDDGIKEMITSFKSGSVGKSNL